MAKKYIIEEVFLKEVLEDYDHIMNVKRTTIPMFVMIDELFDDIIERVEITARKKDMNSYYFWKEIIKEYEHICTVKRTTISNFVFMDILFNKIRVRYNNEYKNNHQQLS